MSESFFGKRENNTKAAAWGVLAAAAMGSVAYFGPTALLNNTLDRIDPLTSVTDCDNSSNKYLEKCEAASVGAIEPYTPSVFELDLIRGEEAALAAIVGFGLAWTQKIGSRTINPKYKAQA